MAPGGSHFHCFGCGAHGDAIDFVRRVNPGMTFREAVLAIGGDSPHSPPGPALPPVPTAPRTESDGPDGWQEFAERLVAESELALWSDQGAVARAYLSGRGLWERTIRAARLGYRPDDEWVEGVYSDRKVRVLVRHRHPLARRAGRRACQHPSPRG